jgi:hypothetical protein
MKKIIEFTLFLLLNNFAFGQNIGNENSIWTFRRQRMNMFNPIISHQVRYNNDTLISGNVYKKYSIDYEPISAFYLRNVNNKVYFYENNQEKLWFDFSLNAGDTLKYQVPNIAYLYDIFSGGNFIDSLYAYSVIDSIKTEFIGGENLVVFYTSPVDSYYSETDMDWRLGKVVSSIGGIDKGLFGHSMTQFLWGIGDGQLVCYRDKIVNYLSNGVTNCEQYVNNELLLEMPECTFYCSPSNADIHIKFNKATLENFHIYCYSLLGAEITPVKTWLAPNEVTINIPGARGVYFLWVRKENGVMSLLRISYGIKPIRINE